MSHGLDAALLALVAGIAGVVASLGPNPVVSFIAQMYVLGSIAGTAVALVRYRGHSDDPRWGFFIALGGMSGAVLGALIALVDALPL